MGNIPDIIVLIIIFIISLISGLISLNKFKKLPIKPYFYQSLALLCFSMVGLFGFISKQFDSLLFLQLTIIHFSLAVQFYMIFFKELFGNFRNYQVLQAFMYGALGFIVVQIFLTPPTFTDTDLFVEFPIILALIIEAFLFFWIIVDYTQFSLRKIIKEHLSFKLLFFCLTIICSMLVTGILVILFIQKRISLYIPLSVQIVSIILILYMLIKYPFFNFLALVNPQFLLVMHKSGLTIYSYEFTLGTENELFGAALNALESLFKEVFAQEGIEQIRFRGKIVYTVQQQDLTIIYVDNVQSTFLHQVLQQFTEHVSKKYRNQIKNFVGDISEFNNLETDLKEFFDFLPQMHK